MYGSESGREREGEDKARHGPISRYCSPARVYGGGGSNSSGKTDRGSFGVSRVTHVTRGSEFQSLVRMNQFGERQRKLCCVSFLFYSVKCGLKTKNLCIKEFLVSVIGKEKL